MSTTKNVLTERKLQLTAPALDGAIVRYEKPQQPSLIPRIVDNQPHLLVYTNLDNDKNRGVIEAKMDTYTFWALMGAIKGVANGTIDQYTCECKGHPFTKEGRSKDALVMTRVTVGRDKDDWPFIMVTDFDKSRPRIKFRFEPSEYHNWMNREGQTLPPKEVGNLYADAWVNAVGSLVSSVLVNEFVTYEEIKARREARRGGGGGGYGGGNGNGNGNSGYNNNNNGGGQRPRQAAAAPADDYDNDIPF